MDQERTPSHVCEACPGNTGFRVWQTGARDSGNKIAASAHGMGSGGLAVDAMSIGCLGVDRRVERFFSYLAIFVFFRSVSSTGAENQFQVDDNGHVGRPCVHLKLVFRETSQGRTSLHPLETGFQGNLALFCELRGLCRHSYSFASYGASAVTRTSDRGHLAEAKPVSSK